MKFLVATNNAHKVGEIVKIWDDANDEFFALSDLGIASDPEETGTTFLDNARIKATAALDAFKEANKSGKAQVNPYDYIVIADDSGLCVDALDGAPGLYSARFASADGSNSNYADNNSKLLVLMKNENDRSTHFECHIVALVPQNGKHVEVKAAGQCFGKIAHTQTGQHGFGYDPLFLPDEYEGTRSFAELSEDEKNKISHRANALKNLKAKLVMC